MELPEQGQPNEAVTPDATSMMEDIYIPGIGVRGALSDEGSASFPKSSWIYDQCVYARSVVSGYMRGTSMAFPGRTLRLKEAFNSIRCQFRILCTDQTRLSRKIANRVGRGLLNTGKSSTSHGRSAFIRMRRAIGPPLATCTTQAIPRAWQTIVAILLRGIKIVQLRIEDIGKLTTKSQSMSAAWMQHCPRVRLIPHQLAAGCKSQLRNGIQFCSRIRISGDYETDLTRLRQATPALGILVLIIVFAIQEIVTVAKH